jgi:hypothetical protein
MTRKQRSVYTRPTTAASQLARVAILLAVTLGLVPLKLVGVLTRGVTRGAWTTYSRSRPRNRRTD